jgi:hypothetical protein
MVDCYGGTGWNGGIKCVSDPSAVARKRDVDIIMREDDQELN